MNPDNEQAGQSIPYWTYVDVGLFFLVPVFIGVVLRLAVRLRFLAHEDFTKPSLAFQLATLSFLLSTLYGILKFRYRRAVWSSLGWKIPLLRHAAAGILVGAALSLMAVWSTHSSVSYPWIEFVLLAVVLGPFLEESLFRGCLLPLAVRTTGSFWGVIGVASLFALLHGPDTFMQWFWYFTTGTIYGWLRMSSGTTSAAMIAHSAYNLGLFLFPGLC
jgi:membrane protease YdiL (CAAX protease family)